MIVSMYIRYGLARAAVVAEVEGYPAAGVS